MARFTTSTNFTPDAATGEKALDANGNRAYLAIQNRHASTVLKVYIVPKGLTEPASLSEPYYNIAAGQLWERRGADVPGNLIWIAQASGTGDCVVEEV